MGSNEFSRDRIAFGNHCYPPEVCVAEDSDRCPRTDTSECSRHDRPPELFQWLVPQAKACLNMKKIELLDFNSSACSFELLLEACSIFLGDSFLDRSASGNQILSLLESKTGDSTDFLNDRNCLAICNTLEDDIELCLLFNFFCSSSDSTCNSNWSCGGNIELLFHCLDEVRDLHHSHVCDCFQDFFFSSHIIFSLCILTVIAGLRKRED